MWISLFVPSPVDCSPRANPRQFGGFFREMNIGASEQPCITMALLGGAYDEADFGEIIKAPVERAHRLHGATGEEFSTGEYSGVRPLSVDSRASAANTARERRRNAGI